MKRQLILAVLAIVAVILTTGAVADENTGLIPVLKSQDGNIKLTTSGYFQGVYSHDLGKHSADDGTMLLTGLRPMLTLSVGEHWEFDGDFNFAELQSPRGNYIRALDVGYKFDDQWKLHVGRVYTAALYTLPFESLLETVHYPSADPFGCYAWGATLEGDLGDGWNLKASITGNSAVPIFQSGTMNRLEATARLEKAFGEQGTIAATTQFSKDFIRAAVDYTWKPSKVFYLRGEVAYSHNMDTRTSDRIGAYAMGVYRPVHWFEFHSMIDGTVDLEKSYMHWETSTADDGTMSAQPVRMFTSSEIDVTWTNGVRFFTTKNDALSFTIDFAKALDDHRPDTILARLQFTF